LASFFLLVLNLIKPFVLGLYGTGEHTVKSLDLMPIFMNCHLNKVWIWPKLWEFWGEIVGFSIASLIDVNKDRCRPGRKSMIQTPPWASVGRLDFILFHFVFYGWIFGAVVSMMTPYHRHKTH